MKTCHVFNKDFHPLGYASHMAKHRRELEQQRALNLLKIRESGWNIIRDNFTLDRFHIVKDNGHKFGLYTYNEAIRIAIEQLF